MDEFEKILPKILSIPIFEDFSKDDENDVNILKSVYDKCSVKNFKKGDIIIKEGDEGDLFYLLYNGTVSVSRKTLAGDVIALADLNSDMNIFFGETVLISNDTRTATVTALTDCATIVLSGKDFNVLCEKQPLLGCRVFKVIAERMMKTISQTNRDKATLYEALFEEIENIE